MRNSVLIHDLHFQKHACIYIYNYSVGNGIHQLDHTTMLPYPLGDNTPAEIRAAGRAAHRNTEKLALLLDEWTSCQGQWKESNLYLRLSESTRHRKCGARCWLTRAELIQKYGDVTAANHIYESKLAEDDGSGAQIRPHPDCPLVPDPRMHTNTNVAS